MEVAAARAGSSPAAPVARPLTAAELEPYFRAGKAAGCPADQMLNFARAGLVLHPKQLRASAAARECDRDGGPTSVGMGGARAGGKSFWVVAQMGADDCQRLPGLKCLLLRKVGKSNRENFEDLKRAVFAHLPHSYMAREGILEFRNGSRIVTGHFKEEADIDLYLGLQYDVIAIEESTTLSRKKKLDVRGSLRTSKAWRPREYETTNPGGIDHEGFKKKYILPYREMRESDTRFIPATAEDNPSINKEYVTDVLDRYTGWQRRAWKDGDWDIAAGQYFTAFDYQAHVLPRAGFDLQGGWDAWCALDYGLTHYTACYLVACDGDGDLYYLDEHAERDWVPSRHAEAIKRMLGRWGLVPDDLSAFLAGADVFAKRQDGDRIGTIAEEYARHGIVLTPANTDRVAGAAELYRRLGSPADPHRPDVPAVRPTVHFLDTCPRLIACIPALQRDPRRPEDVLKVDCDEDGEGGDDFYDAARYGYMRKAAGPQYAPQPTVVGPRRDFSTYVVR
jgi:phage terminase large subunit